MCVVMLLSTVVVRLLLLLFCRVATPNRFFVVFAIALFCCGCGCGCVCGCGCCRWLCLFFFIAFGCFLLFFVVFD